MTALSTPALPILLADAETLPHRPLLFVNARVVTGDSLIGDFDRADVLLGGSRIVGIGPGLLSAAADDGAIVIECEGSVIMPVVIDGDRLTETRSADCRNPRAIAPGNPATFAILTAVPGETGDKATLRLADGTAPATIVTDGIVTHRDRVAPATHDAGSAGGQYPVDRIGTWIDENDFVHQHLTADGRYDETRGGRKHAYQGNFWITGDRIDYRDDLGFWAFGEFDGDTLLHAGYTFHHA